MRNDYGTLRRHVWAIPFEIVMVGGAIILLGTGNYPHLAVALFLLAVSILPLVIERRWRVRLPVFLQASYVAFLFASMYAGEVLEMYARFHPWDDIMHFISGLLVGLGSVVWLTSIIARAHLKVSPWLYALCVFCLGATVAVIWEVIEFSSDQLFGTIMQRNDLYDTMTDLLFGMGSVLLIALLTYQFLRQRRSLGLNRLIEHYVHLNR